MRASPVTDDGARASDPWYARVVFRALGSWGAWARCVLGVVLVVAVVGLVVGGVIAGALLVASRLAPALPAVTPAVAGLGAGGVAALGTATAVWRRRRR